MATRSASCHGSEQFGLHRWTFSAQICPSPSTQPGAGGSTKIIAPSHAIWAHREKSCHCLSGTGSLGATILDSVAKV